MLECAIHPITYRGEGILATIVKSDMSNILLNGCKIENGTVQTDSGDVFFKNCDFDNLKVQTDMGDLCFIGKEDVMRTWSIQI